MAGAKRKGKGKGKAKGKGEGKAAAAAEKKKKVLVETYTAPHGMEFFSIDLERGEVMKLATEVLDKEGVISSLVTYGGSTIYLFGLEKLCPSAMSKLENEKLNERGFVHGGVSYTDVISGAAATAEWKAGPPHPVKPPHPLVWIPNCRVLGDKIYAFTYGAHKAEVFDPKLNQWTHLIPPPKGLTNFRIQKPVLADPSNNRLLVGFHGDPVGSLYAYYPAAGQDQGRWDLLVPQYDPKSFVLAVDSGVIFSYVPVQSCNRLFTAFDVDSKQHLNISFSSDLDDRLWIFDFYALLNLGNSILCLVAPAVSDSCTPPKTYIYTIQFKIHRTSPRDVVIIPFPGEFFSLGEELRPLTYAAL